MQKIRKLTSTNYANHTQLTATCPMQLALSRISGRWKLLLLWYVHQGVCRFTALQAQVPAITSKMLSQQLRELVDDGLLTKHIYPESPPRVEYTMTEAGARLIPILVQLNAWGESLTTDSAASPDASAEHLLSSN